MALLEAIQDHQFLSAIILLVLLAYGYHILIIGSTPSEPHLVKGYIPLLGVTPQIILSPVSFLNSCRARYGDIFTIYALGFRVTLVTDPIQGIPAVFKKSKQLSFKAGLRRVYTKILGFSEERVEMEDMNREHFQMIPPYLLATSAVDELTGRFIRFLVANLRREQPELRKGKIVDLAEWIGGMLFFASGAALYGEGVFDGADTVLQDFKTADEGFPMRLILPLWMTRGFETYRNRVQAVLSTRFGKGLKDPSNFVNKRIEIQQKYGQSLEQVGSDLFGLTFALMTNTMPISFWYAAFIVTSAKYRQPVLDRIQSYVLPNATIDSENLFDVSGLLGDPLLQACFQETLRLRTQNGSMRVVNEATTIPVLGQEYYVRQGSIVFIPAPLIHMDTEIYSHPERYDPERFLGANLETTLIANDPTHVDEEKTQVKAAAPKFFKKGVPVRHYMLPFGGGDNLCTGRRFAQNEVIAMAATILCLFDITDAKGGKLREPVKPAGKRFGVAAEGPGKPFMVKLKLKESA